LTLVTRTVTRAGKQHEQGFWVRPEDVATAQAKGTKAKELTAISERAAQHLKSEILALEDSKEYGEKVLENKEINHYDESKRGVSTSETPDGGFPEGHPLHDPVMRSRIAYDAAEALSYSNSVGLGAALRYQAQLDAGLPLRRGSDNDHIKTFQRQMPTGVSLSDVNKALHSETQGLLKKHGITEMVVYRGTGNEQVAERLGKASPQKAFDVNLDVHGFSSFSTNPTAASQFGQHVLSVKIPAERIMTVPSMFPKQLRGVPGFLGGSRRESEVIVTSGVPLVGVAGRRETLTTRESREGWRRYLAEDAESRRPRE
jgi:hypothetical protein